MICPRCSKYYFKESYFRKHIQENRCFKKQTPYVEQQEISKAEVEIEEAIKKVTDELRNPEKVLEKGMEEIISKVVKKEDDLKKQMETMYMELNILKERVKMLENNQKNNTTDFQEKIEKTENLSLVVYNKNKSVKKERLPIDDDTAKKFLKYRDIDSDAELLGKYYFDDEQECIKRNKKNEITFWNGDEWAIDNGTNLRNILVHNLRKLYTKINVVTENSSSSGDTLANQEHINNLNSKKYQSSLYNTFVNKFCV